MANPCVIWRIIDGKRGHERQTQGLIEALGRLMPVEVTNIPCLSLLESVAAALGFGSPFNALPSPTLIVGAGHSTHATMLALKQAYGGKSLVLMKPSLPRRWFDLCLIPQHDEVTGTNVFVTQGAINPIQPFKEKDAALGLILVGGVSSHYEWDEASVVDQVGQIVQSGGSWQLTTSPRTPASTLQQLENLNLPQLSVLPFVDTPSDWLPEQMSMASQIWVTPDSVSMVYEALTSGAAVGLMELTKKQEGRVVRGVEGLAQKGRVRWFHQWVSDHQLPIPATPFNEAARCAQWIRDNWFPEGGL